MRYHIVVGGEIEYPGIDRYRDISSIHYAGKFENRDRAYDEWKALSWMNVDNAHMRFLIIPYSMEEFDEKVKKYKEMGSENPERQAVLDSISLHQGDIRSLL